MCIHRRALVRPLCLSHLMFSIQFFVVTHRGSSDTEIDHYISTLLQPAVVIYVFSRWGKDPKHTVSGSVCFYEVAAVLMELLHQF